MTFRIATFNLHQGFKRWEERRELIVEQLGELSPDILALNEISVPLQTGRWLQQVTRDRLGLQYALIQYNKSNELSQDEAQGLLTSFPVIETGGLEYLARNRIAQVTRVEIEGQYVDIYLTHLHHVPEEDGLRQYEVQRLFQWIESRDDVSTRIVCGDFNATPDEPSIKLIPDSFRTVQTAPTCPTSLEAPGELPIWHGFARPGPIQPFSWCYDYIWITEKLEVHDAGQCFNQPHPDDPTLWPSDHVGVWADLSLFARNGK
jgi:endonuclease/exonuclease/phosphatase family metal-dependent hydrolase